MDNLFTSVTLMDQISDIGIGCKGKLKVNRLKALPNLEPKALTKQYRQTDGLKNG